MTSTLHRARHSSPKCFSACPGSSWEPSSAKCDSATWDDILIMNLSRHEEEDNLDSRRTRSTRLVKTKPILRFAEAKAESFRLWESSKSSHKITTGSDISPQSASKFHTARYGTSWPITPVAPPWRACLEPNGRKIQSSIQKKKHFQNKAKGNAAF